MNSQDHSRKQLPLDAGVFDGVMMLLMQKTRSMMNLAMLGAMGRIHR